MHFTAYICMYMYAETTDHLHAANGLNNYNGSVHGVAVDIVTVRVVKSIWLPHTQTKCYLLCNLGIATQLWYSHSS